LLERASRSRDGTGRTAGDAAAGRGAGTGGHGDGRNRRGRRPRAAAAAQRAQLERSAPAGVVPEPLLAIPVLEIELNGDGSVRRIEVLRAPRQAKDTIELATRAVHRAAPFGNVSRLPRPWKFVETFLFDDDRRFKPRTLD
jgi:hypothetical protein